MSENRIFVDKTEFVSEFMDSDYEVNAILRPRRFGKSTNLAMLRHFFSTDTSESDRGFFMKSLLGKNQAFIESNFSCSLFRSQGLRGEHMEGYV
jgi:hypothetical protein